MFRFGLKYWFISAVSVPAIILLLWLLPSGDFTLEYYYNFTKLLQTWQPFYFWRAFDGLRRVPASLARRSAPTRQQLLLRRVPLAGWQTPPPPTPHMRRLTAGICMQRHVESSVPKGVLRATVSLVGGLVGYLLMLNGSLAQDPYWICGMLVLFNGLSGLFCVFPSFR